MARVSTAHERDLASNFGVATHVIADHDDVARTHDQEQRSIMQTQFPLFYNHPSVEGITLWGYVVGSTWVNGSGLIQSNGTPRPAMTWLRTYIGR